MELESPRLRLRHWRPEDRAVFAAINDEPSVRRHLARLTRAGSDAMLDRIEAHFDRHGWGLWALEERAGGSLIGLCGLEHIDWKASFTPAVAIGWRPSAPWAGPRGGGDGAGLRLRVPRAAPRRQRHDAGEHGVRGAHAAPGHADARRVRPSEPAGRAPAAPPGGLRDPGAEASDVMADGAVSH